jgi:hypothetical protein
MQRLTIITESGTANLGMTAVTYFFRAMETDSLDSLQNITDDFKNRLESMQTDNNFGFTDEYKKSFLKLFEVGKKCLITNDWALSQDKKKFYLNVIKKCNEGKTLTEALQEI